MSINVSGGAGSIDSGFISIDISNMRSPFLTSIDLAYALNPGDLTLINDADLKWLPLLVDYPKV